MMKYIVKQAGVDPDFIDFHKYLNLVKSFINMSLVRMKELYFICFIDINKDMKICETDLFNLMHKLENIPIKESIHQDIKVLLKYIQEFHDATMTES